MNEQNMTFEQWTTELERLAEGAYGEGYDYTQECWRHYYDEGYSPQGAFEQDKLCWDPE